MSIPGRKVFLIGPGYIGREVIDCLLESEDHVTALVRRESAGKELEKDPGKWIDSSVWHGKAHTWEKMAWLKEQARTEFRQKRYMD